MTTLTICLYLGLGLVLGWLAWGRIMPAARQTRALPQAVDEAANSLFDAWPHKD